jgi:hypothetical protein
LRVRPSWLAAAALGGLLGCKSKAPEPAPPPRYAPVPTPAVDGADACADVGMLRACWGAAGAPRLVPRPLPSRPAFSEMGWRCAWPGPVRLCVDRSESASSFECKGTLCTQRHARLPDDGEWTCADAAGAVVCVGGERAAGVVAGPPDAAWICGARRGADARAPGGFVRRLAAASPAPLGARVCVDLSPDVPDGDLSRWRCHFENGPPAARVCQEARGAAVLSVACDRQHPCVDGAACVEGRCLPAARPAPSCWLDGDCAGGACRFGTCRAEAATP